MGKSSKRYKAAKDALEPDRLYSPTEAIRLLKGSDTASFDETVEVHIHLGVNTRHADQQVRGTIVLPYGTGQDVRVAVFAEGEKATEVEEAVQEMKAGKVEYRTDRYGVVHVIIGKKSFEEEALVGNYSQLLAEINRVRPASAKGRYLRSITLTSTMGPGIPVDQAKTKALLEGEE